jgi:ribokinase
MTILCVGSINCDHIYRVPHFSQPGESLTSLTYHRLLGGKGMNQSIALVRAGAQVHHVGCVGRGDAWIRSQIEEHAVDTSFIADVDVPTGHAIIQVADDGQNSIVVFPGANHCIELASVTAAMVEAGPHDWLLLQNEVNDPQAIIAEGRRHGLRIAFNPAPFTPEVLDMQLDAIDLLIVNEVEACGLAGCDEAYASLDTLAEALPGCSVLLTQGGDGCTLARGAERLRQPAFPVDPVDTTGAGDTFIGYYLAALTTGHSEAEGLRIAARAAALCVSRPGTAQSIPELDEVRQADSCAS